MNTLAFDIYSDWAHFKKFYTTASPLTFHIPPITSLKGIIGAMLGLSNDPESKNFYLDILNGFLFGIQIINPIKTYRMGYNWIETKRAKYMQIMPPEKSRYQTVIETIRNPHYRIYVGVENENFIFNKLRYMLQQHKCIYTPYMGISEHILDFKYIGLYNAKEETNTNRYYIPISTVVDIENILDTSEFLKIEIGKIYQKDRIPVEMNHNRTVTKYSTVLYEINGNNIFIKLGRYWQLENGLKIYLFKS